MSAAEKKQFWLKCERMGIPADQILKLWEYAVAKSKQVGKSIDELVDMIANVRR